MKYVSWIIGAAAALSLLTSCNSSSEADAPEQAVASGPLCEVASATDVDGAWSYHIAHETADPNRQKLAVSDQILLYVENQAFLEDADFDLKRVDLTISRGVDYSLTPEAHKKWEELNAGGVRRWCVIRCNGKPLAISRFRVSAAAKDYATFNTMSIQELRNQKITMNVF